MDETVKKQVLRLFTYGLYVVTAHDERDGDAAFLANWLTQASFDPPLVAVSVENDSHSIGIIRASGRFTVNVLETGQRELAGHFGRAHRNVGDKLASRAITRAPEGDAVLPEALAWCTCHVTGSLPAGDSTIFVGEVVDVALQRPGHPLTMAEAGFRHAG